MHRASNPIGRDFWTALALFLLVATALTPAAQANARPGKAAVASAHPMATAAGLEILAAGGNAFDAAVAISATLAVVEPYSSGLGGGGFWLLHHAQDGTEVMVDGRERAPGAATADMYLDAEGRVDRRLALSSGLSPGIPGTVAALDHIAREYGTMPLSRTLAPAIRAARNGFEVTERYRLLAGFKRDVMRNTPAGDVFLVDGEIPKAGSLVVQTDLAGTLSAIAEGGAAAFYRGPIARQLVAGVRAAGGIWSREDLADYAVVERAPVVTEYRGTRVVAGSSPSSGGIVIAQALGMLAEFDLSALSEADRRHLIIEVLRRGYRDRAEYLGDPDFVDIPRKALLDPTYLSRRADTIEITRATSSRDLPPLPVPAAATGGEDTTHFSVLDSAGNRVAATMSINTSFGSGQMPAGTGVVLNNEMDDFAARVLTPNAWGLVGVGANQIAPGKRPLSSMTPVFLDDGRRVALLGTPGGSRIISMVLLGILDFVDAGGDADSMVSAPRFHHQYIPDVVQFEKGELSERIRADLERRGHEVTELRRRYGNMQVVVWDRVSGDVRAASDPRGEGASAVFDYAAARRR